MTGPADLPRRSFLYRKLTEAGARFETFGDTSAAVDYGDPPAEREAAKRMGLADLSPLPRTGFKGAGTPEWLAKQGLAVPEESNRASRQEDGALAARLAPNELLILGPVAAKDEGSPAALEAAWQAESLPPDEPRGYPLPRGDSHAWFLVTGEQAAAMFAKICGVDLRPGRFDDLAIAQTSIARITAIAIRDDRGGYPAYHLLCDSASANYFWDCLLDAMAEFDGRPVGLAALT